MNPGSILAALRQALDDAFAPALHRLLGLPVQGDPRLPVGTVYRADRMLFVGIPTRDGVQATLIVRDGLRDVLEWLQDPEPFWLQVAVRHYGIKR